VAAIFRRLQAIYGSRWTASIDGIEEDAVREWSRALADMTPTHIRRGLDSLRGEWPPTLPEFVALCRPAAPYHREYRPERLLDAPRPEAAARQAIREMRESLGMPT
jgi:hypothetical protein